MMLCYLIFFHKRYHYLEKGFGSLGYSGLSVLNRTFIPSLWDNINVWKRENALLTVFIPKLREELLYVLLFNFKCVLSGSQFQFINVFAQMEHVTQI